MKSGKAFVVVDVQRDFCPGGSLPVANGDEVVKPINKVVRLFEVGLPTIFTRDWHPMNHCSFRGYGGTWPPHCIQNTRGAEFHPELRIPKKAIIINKGADPKREAYSGFDGTELADILKEKGVAELYVGGLATDYCVKNTVFDALKNGLSTYILVDCIRGVNLKPGDSESALKEMITTGAKAITSDSLTRTNDRRVAVLSSS